jgi:hypothetical protein
MRVVLLLVVAAGLAGCADKVSKEEQEAAKNTFVCHLNGDRLVIRFDIGEARMLMPSGERISLYQIPVPVSSGVRFSNGNLELRGKGTELTLIDNATLTPTELKDCAPYSLPKP